MPRPRPASGPTPSDATQKRKELTPYTRGRIEGMHMAGASLGQISTHLHIPRTTVHTTLRQLAHQPNGVSAERSGRPRRYTEREERRIVEEARRRPDATCRQLQEAVGTSASARTVGRVLKQHELDPASVKRRQAAEKRAEKRAKAVRGGKQGADGCGGREGGAAHEMPEGDLNKMDRAEEDNDAGD